ncbi:MAG: hypothetical protein H0S84_04205 [Bacteroidales bacterium]|nr:hypothetical protein [Bacteroidales bacterium]
MKHSDPSLRLHACYAEKELENMGLRPFKKTEPIQGRIYIGTDRVYFFSEIGDNKLELYSAINQSSFYLHE